MPYHDTPIDRWSRNGQIMAMAVAVEVAMAITTISSTELHRPRVLVVAAAIGIASAVLVARARMPAMAKSVLIAVVCAALLALAAAQDPFGLRAIDRSIDAATRETYVAPIANNAPQTAAAGASSQVSLRATGDASATAFADDLARGVALKAGQDAGLDHVDGIIDVSSGPSGDTYRLTWSIGRAADSLWCGRIVAVGQARAAVLDSFSTTIATALRRGRDGALTCS